ncbi:MAG: phenylalanine--tRNA ligase beta subunit-related protein, partial [Vampirovibrionia bacterium]
MLVSLEWLNELVNIEDLKPEELGEALTMSGLEVEEIEYIKPKFTKVYTAKIEAISQHPDASKIRLVDVNYGFGTQRVVCGAQNIEEGQTIAFGLEGAIVFNRKDGTQFELKKATIRGVESSGMICSASELGLEGKEYEPFEAGVIILNQMKQFENTEIKLGVPLEELLNLPVDTVIHTAPTANRGDLMSMRGIANEISAIFNRPVKMPAIEVNTNALIENEQFNLAIKDEDTCKYYALGLVKDVKIKESPSWMKRRLEASGMRAISNIVDITNYVMLEYGQPLHAFDFN